MAVHNVSILSSESIHIGKDITSFIASETIKSVKASTFVIITDRNVAKYHLNHLENEFKLLLENQRLLSFIVEPGEAHKTRKTKEIVEDWMLAQKCTRDTCVIALGGGVIGDLVGFTSSTFMRGVPVIQVPTTLLAMVDSSIGGKTAIDTPHGKNLIGSFHQPRHIFIDTSYLKTLPKREFVNGMAEVIKTAAIWNESEFEMLENSASKILALIGGAQDQESEILLVKLILGSVSVKAHVVTIDEKETGLRGLLNFGHSVGHAIEAILFPEMLHGECVSIGMVKEAEIARHLGLLKNVSVGRLVRCLQSYGLPVSLDDKILKQNCPNKHCSVDQLLDIMKVDKKNQGNQKRIVLLSKIGKTFEPKASFVPDEVIKVVLSPAIQVVPTFSAENTFRLKVPGSKSISNRALVMAALGKGPCRLHGLLHSDDVQVMLNSLQKLVGIKFAWENDGETLLIEGGGGRLVVPESELYLGNAGTAARFLTTVCASIKRDAKALKIHTVVTGNARMKQRPIGPLVESLIQNGCKIKYLESKGCLPLEIEANDSGFIGGVVSLSASVSSQYVSSILISAPYASNPVILDLSGDSVISQPYIDMTIAMMKSFGISVERIEGTNKYKIPQGVYQNPPDYHIEADASSATYPLAFAAITGSTVMVENIGKVSLQGDSEFAVKVCREMGCKVEQTDSTTTVTGPKVLKPLSTIDMETMTDAFMTATVLAAVAQGGDCITRITGIANQRVKECDRIAAMIEQLARFGVRASELPDGIQIHGIDRSELKSPDPNGIKCYDDHRIAMSFSILSCALPQNLPGAIITEKKCVEKTWPSWWDTLKNTLKISLKGIDMHPPNSASESNSHDISNVILIGMRGAGKTHLGKAAAESLGLKFIDMDNVFEKHVSSSIPEFLKSHSWDEFRALESQLLQETIKNEHQAIIACGGGIIETEAARKTLKESKAHVIHVTRNIVDIEEYLNSDTSRPTYGEDFKSVWNRRKPLYRECSTLEFVYPSKNGDLKLYWKRVEQDFVRFLSFNLKKTAFPLPTAVPSFFVSLTCSDVKEYLPILEKMTQGASAIELRVDLLGSYEIDSVGEQIALLRSSSPLPIVFTVRSTQQGGKFPNEEFAKMIELLNYGFKWGCEYVDIEWTQPYDRFKNLKINKACKIIGSFHDVLGQFSWVDGMELQEKYRELHQKSDIVKMVGYAHSIQDNYKLDEFVSKIGHLGLSSKPGIFILMGPLGRLSRALNSFLTPVTHSSIPIPAAPGQMTIVEIHKTREALGLLSQKKFYLFGSPISQSMSPVLHNTGFSILGLPHEYQLFETNEGDQVLQVMKRSDSFGASVTIPLKIDVAQLVDRLSESAQAIGAVNTLTKTIDGIYGDNTDWIGIKNCIEKTNIKPKIGVVLGAGGTARAACYALKNLSYLKEIRIWNRTKSKAESLAKEFGATVCSWANIFTEDCVIVSTVPSQAQNDMDLNFIKNGSGIIIDMAYRPHPTRLLDASKSGNWVAIPGLEVLLEQGYEQFERWTRLIAPKSEIRTKVWETYQ